MTRTVDIRRLPLDYESWDPEAEIALLADDSLGAGWEITPLSVELASEQTLGHLAAAVAGTLRLIPEGYAVQLLVHVRPTQGREIARWREAAAGPPILGELARRREDYLRRFWVRLGPLLFFAKDIRVYLFLRTPPVPIPRAFRDPAGAAEREYLAARGAFLSSARDLEGSLSALGLAAQRLTARDAFELSWSILNPRSSHEGPPPAYDPHRLFADQVVAAPILRDPATGTLGVDGGAYRAVTVWGLPQAGTFAGMLTLEAAAGAVRASILDYIPCGVVSLSMVKPDQERVRGHLGLKETLAAAQSRLSAHARQMYGDVVGMRSFLAQGHEAYEGALHVALWGADADADDLEARVRALRSALSALEFAVAVEDAYNDAAFLGALPWGIAPREADWTDRRFLLHDVNVSHLAGVWQGFSGSRTPDHLLLDRRGRAVPFSLYDTPEGLAHTLIVAPPGRGKSFLLKSLVCDILRRGGHVAILNKHTRPDLETNDYYRLAQVLGEAGHFVRFDPDDPPNLDSCAGEYSKEQNLFLTCMLSEIVTMGRRRLEPHEVNAVSEKVGQAYEFFRARQAGRFRLRDVRALMAGSKEEITRKLGMALAMYTGKGPYAGFFDGDQSPQLVPGVRYVCYELGLLAQRQEILVPLSLMLFHHTTRRFEALPPDVPKLLVLEEAWMLLSSPVTGSYIADRSRTYRKVRGAVVAVTQHARDLDTEAGRTVLGDASNRLLLRHDAQEAADTAEFLKLTDEERQALTSLASQPGFFSEILVSSPQASGIARLVLGPHMYWLLTTRPQDLAAIEAARQERSDATELELIEVLAERHPHGAPA